MNEKKRDYYILKFYLVSISVCCYLITNDPECLIPVEGDDNCHGDTTGKRGGRMSQDEWYLVNLRDISSFSYVLAGKTLHA